MSQNLTELCTVLIGNEYGELASHLFSTLAEHGRLTVNALAYHSQVSPNRVRSCVSTLIEQQLLLHHAADEDAPIYYQVNWRNAYDLARRTSVVSLVHHRHGEDAEQIVRAILQLGHVRVGDMVDALELTTGSERDSGVDTTEQHISAAGMVNGIARSHLETASRRGKRTTLSTFHSTLRTLLRSGILAKVSMRSYMPLSDLQERLEETVISKTFPDRKVSGPKKQVEFRREVNILKRKWREVDEYSDVRDLGSKGTIKRSGTSTDQAPNKRAKLNGGLPNNVTVHDSSDMEVEQATPKLSPDLVVRVDYARCALARRTQRLEELAKLFLGDVTSAVYRALLQSLERKVGDSGEDFRGNDDGDGQEAGQHTANISEIFEFLHPAVNLSSTLKGSSSHLTNGVGKARKKLHIMEDDVDIDIKSEQAGSVEDVKTHGVNSHRDRSKRLSLVESHLALLEEHPKHFCTRVRTAGISTEWSVNFAALTETLIQAELDATIKARHGKIATRIVRMLREHSKLDEKQVANKCMMRIKDVRALLTHLQLHGVVDVQELPKDHMRQPSKTLYLWLFDSGRVRQLVLQQTYKAMTRTLQRIPVERERFRTAIEKAERTDVKGHEQEMLGLADKTQLREWREIEERLLTQVDRMDDVVAVLRDFSGKDTSLIS